MPEHKTGSWNVTTNDRGDVMDVRSPGHTYGGEKNRALVVAAINEDVAAGIAPRDIATWGHEYKNSLKLGSEAWYWLSYLQLVWYSVEEGVDVEKRRRTAKRLEDILRDLINDGDRPDLIRTGVFGHE